MKAIAKEVSPGGGVRFVVEMSGSEMESLTGLRPSMISGGAKVNITRVVQRLRAVENSAPRAAGIARELDRFASEIREIPFDELVYVPPHERSGGQDDG